jgi:enoyl-CoA hydratase/carnithine racemase
MRPLTLTGGDFAAAIDDPAGGEWLSTAAGNAPVVVAVRDGRDAARLDRAVVDGPGAGLAAVVLAVVADPALVRSALFADVVLVAPTGAELDRLTGTVAANPLAATAFALLLRTAPATPGPAEPAAVQAGLIAESATYSMLQAGPEFARWRAATPIRPADARTDRVLARRTGQTLEITLNRPERRNALDTAMRDALVEALTIAASATDLRVSLQGAGSSFCAGGDLDEFGTADDPPLAHVVRLTRSPARLLARLAGRTEARLHGACLGSGIELPAFAGRVIAAPDTRIGLPEIGLGLIPGAGGTVSLPYRIGRHRTAYLALSGERIDADTALRWGLVDAIAEPGRSTPWTFEGRRSAGLLTNRRL